MIRMIWPKKRKGGVVMLFQDPSIGLVLARRIAARNLICGRWECPAGNGGEKKLAAGCPGSSFAVAGRVAGTGRNSLLE